MSNDPRVRAAYAAVMAAQIALEAYLEEGEINAEAAQEHSDQPRSGDEGEWGEYPCSTECELEDAGVMGNGGALAGRRYCREHATFVLPGGVVVPVSGDGSSSGQNP